MCEQCEAINNWERKQMHPVNVAGQKPDMVNNPPHYTTGKIEVLDFILDQKLDYLPGQVVKYICRAKHKGARLQDLKKAEFYLKRAIKELESNDIPSASTPA
jgi:hypothetical protein